MQQLKVEQKEQEQIKRECKGRSLALTRNVFRLEKTDSFYCQSENNANVYYFIRYAQINWFGVHVPTTQLEECNASTYML